MKNRKSIIAFIAVLLVGSAVMSNAARRDEITLLMVPREEEMIRLAMDIANKYPLLLISYKVGGNNAVSLQGWTGSQWVSISMDNFLRGDFFRKGPESALVVEKAGVTVPGTLLPPSDWCASLSKIRTTDMRPLLHLTGQYFDFTYDEWKWFAKRYNMDMSAINPESLNVAWYHRNMSANLQSQKEQGASDLQYWESIRQPVVAVAAGPADTGQEIPAPAAAAMENPLTNDVPEAVVLGPADADEAISEVLADPDAAPVNPPSAEEAKPPAADVGSVTDAMTTEIKE